MEKNDDRLPVGLANDEIRYNFCKGQAGVIIMLCIASEVFPDKRGECLEGAVHAAEHTWDKGLVLKGHGLCHGIPGNGYAFHCLFRTFYKLQEQMDDTE